MLLKYSHIGGVGLLVSVDIPFVAGTKHELRLSCEVTVLLESYVWSDQLLLFVKVLNQAIHVDLCGLVVDELMLNDLVNALDQGCLVGLA